MVYILLFALLLRHLLSLYCTIDGPLRKAKQCKGMKWAVNTGNVWENKPYCQHISLDKHSTANYVGKYCIIAEEWNAIQELLQCIPSRNVKHRT